ncbi:signal peptide peptidase SppA [Candidatus Micrarchaeota archaeon CG10_big_fil_rev_8_21_14_0_10_45_29]|nr:MAG: signal peptide peptidase SppA [Candidatus Micrarchaeota archaeon CG10_big_fil_rev_8_21_14_0_10_45_29]
MLGSNWNIRHRICNAGKFINMVRFNKIMAKKQISERRRAAIELPSSPLWGWALVALMALFIIAGIFLIATGGIADARALGGGCVGVVRVEGEILAESVPESFFDIGVAGSEQIADSIKKADERSDVKSILLIIDSPGGSTIGSREIYTALKESDKPKVAYFRQMAASGGYYVAMGTDYIVSEPDALTGSIGARMSLMQLSGLFEKLGYNETIIKTGEMKDIGNPGRDASDEEIAILQSIVDESFDEFKQVILENRGSRLNMDAFEGKVLDARILSGRQAYDIGMVDEIGPKKRAIEKASQMAGFDEALEVCEMNEKDQSFFGQMLTQALSSLVAKEKVGAKLQY